MNKRNWIVGTAALALGIVFLSAPASRAEEKKDEVRWDTSFAGHHMWEHDIEAALAKAAKEGRPALVDIYKFH